VPRLTDDSSKSRKHSRATVEQKEEFFRVFDRTGSVTDAAAELGLNRDTCYQWIRKAGLARKRSERPTREDFHRLRQAGASRREAAQTLGIHRTTADEWDTGVRRTQNGRIYPDGRAVDYNSGMTTMTTAAGALTVTRTVPLKALDKVIDERFLSIQEREIIRDMLAAGDPQRKIALVLGRPASTVSREIARNSRPDHGYLPYAAHRAAASRRPRPKESKLAAEGRLREYVKDKLGTRWSPEQISNTLVKEFPDDPEMRVSHETVYQALYVQARGGLKRKVEEALRTGRTRRKPRNNGEQRRSRFVDPMVNISERPPEVEDRAVPGHWEGDLITGTRNQSAIATLVERQTRYVMLVHLSGDHTAETVRDGLIATMSTLPGHLRGSLTWDQGAEMATHKSFSMATDMDVYFCDPASPWQRGSNENMNGLLRQYFPKGTDLSIYGPEDLEHVAQELNGRPRKTLGWDTPAERLRDLLLTT
jgi:transposase, IS30 family